MALWATHPPKLFYVVVVEDFCVRSLRNFFVDAARGRQMAGTKFEPHFNLSDDGRDDDDGIIIIASSINIFSSPAGSTAGNLQIEAK